jgi:hypothetical protein
MKGPTAWIYEAAGAPPMPGNTRGRCRACGQAAKGMPFREWVKNTFTDWDKLYPGEIVCHACLFCFDDQSVALMKRVGRDKPQRMRNYSHFVVGGEWHPLSKAEKSRMRELLLADPTVAVIALSGQKHIIFRARPGWWQIEEQSVRPFPALLARLLEAVEALYRAGATKAEIESGYYSQRSLLAIGLDRWRELESQIKPFRGGLALPLAVFLAQKDGESEDRA